MQEKIAFRAIFYSGGCKVYGVEAGEFSRTEPQSAPQNAMSVIGDPAEQDRWGKTRISRIYSGQETNKKTRNQYTQMCESVNETSCKAAV